MKKSSLRPVVVRSRSLSSSIVAAFAASLLLGHIASAANTENDVVNGQSDLTASGTFSGGSPTTTSDVTFTAQTYSPTAFTLNTPSTNLSIGTLNDLSSTALTLDNTNGSGTTTITLNGGSNSVSGTPGDLLYVASGGTLSIGTASTGTLNLALASTGNLNVAGTATINSAISGSNGLTKTGAGTLYLGGTNTYTGTTTISAGTLVLNHGATYSSNFVDNGTLKFTNNNSSTVNGVISGTGSLLVDFYTGTSGGSTLQTLTLNGANTYSGGTVITVNRVYANNNSALGTGTVTFNASSGNNVLYVGNGINVGNNIIINGGGSQASGTTTGILAYGKPTDLFTTSGSGTFSGTITVNAAPQRGSHFYSGANASTIATNGGVLYVTGAINAGNGYTGDISQQNGLVVYSGGGSYAGFKINDSGSTLTAVNIARLGANNGLSTSARLNVVGGTGNGGIFDMAGYNQSLNGITGSGQIGSSGSGSSILTLTNTANQTFTGKIADTISVNSAALGTGKVGLTVNAAGFTQTLGGANTMSGPITVTAGTLATDGTGTFGSSNITVGASGSLTTGNASSFGDLSVFIFSKNGAANSISLSAGTDIIGSVVDSVSGTSVAGTYTAAQLNTAYNTSVFTGSGSLNIQSVSAIPEPSTYAALAGLGAIAFAYLRRRRRA